jgi:molybdopterin/thiamine biosynthesis adenylyltransferase
MDFSPDQLRRYARHITLPEVGGTGQAKLLSSSVLVVGAGGLGSPLLLYLAAAGVGKLGVVDHDVVDLTNLQRQVLHGTSRIGMAKVDSAKRTIADINPEVNLVPHRAKLDAGNVMDLMAGYDLVADGSDNFAARFLLNDACYFAKKPLVSAAILRFDAQVSTFRAYQSGDNPCYRCLFREPPPPGLIPTCSEGGVLGALAGTIGSLQASEVLKELLRIGEGLSGFLLLYDALAVEFRKIRVHRDPDCPLCGANPTILGVA